MCCTLLLEGSSGGVEEDWEHQKGGGRRGQPAWVHEEGWKLLGVGEGEGGCWGELRIGQEALEWDGLVHATTDLYHLAQWHGGGKVQA